jgi:hypothetical protein
MKWRIVVPVVPVFLTVAVVAGIVNIVRQPKYPMFDDESPELDSIVEKIVESSVQIHNCVLAVMKGDGSFAWSGAAGIADADGSVPITGDTPIHIASITKLFTATAVMQLQEQDALAIDDPMADYLPDELIRGVHVYQGRDYSDEITIEQLLAQTSGIADYYDDKPEGGESCYEMFLKDPERIWTVEETTWNRIFRRGRRQIIPTPTTSCWARSSKPSRANPWNAYTKNFSFVLWGCSTLGWPDIPNPKQRRLRRPQMFSREMRILRKYDPTDPTGRTAESSPR